MGKGANLDRHDIRLSPECLVYLHIIFTWFSMTNLVIRNAFNKEEFIILTSGKACLLHTDFVTSTNNFDQSSGFILERAHAPLAHIFYKWRTENLMKGPTRRTNFRGKIYLVQNSFRIKTLEFTYRVLPSNIYRSLIGRLFFTLFTVVIVSDKRKQTILDFFGGNKKRKDDDNTQIPLSDNPSDQTPSTSRQTTKLKANQNLNLPRKSPCHFRIRG